MVKISKRMKKLIITNYKLILLIVLAFLLVMGIIFMLTQGTLSKYTNRSYYSHNVSAGNFIFSSPDLAEEGQTNVIYDYDFGEVPFSIVNSYLNQYTKVDIDYNITCQVDHGMCVIAGGTDNYDGSYSTSGTITTGGPNGNNHTFNILNLSDYEGPFVVTVTATSTSPYTKTLTGTYILYLNNDNVNPNSLFERVLVKETNEYCEFKVVNKSSVAININNSYQEPAGEVIYDESSEFYQNRYYESSGPDYIYNIKTALLPYSSQTLRYYRISMRYDIPCSNIVHGMSASLCQTPHIKGDVNGDGSVDINDATAIQEYLQHDPLVMKGLDACQLQVADHNGDGIITEDDATALFQYSMLPDLYD